MSSSSSFLASVIRSGLSLFISAFLSRFFSVFSDFGSFFSFGALGSFASLGGLGSLGSFAGFSFLTFSSILMTPLAMSSSLFFLFSSISS
jgi:hypothetical protein